MNNTLLANYGCIAERIDDYTNDRLGMTVIPNSVDYLDPTKGLNVGCKNIHEPDYDIEDKFLMEDGTEYSYSNTECDFLNLIPIKHTISNNYKIVDIDATIPYETLFNKEEI